MATAIIVENLTKRYKEKIAVKGVGFTVEEGMIFGILGPNGAGKTTTIEIMEGIRKRDGGRVEILGFDPGKERESLSEWIGIQFQATAIQQEMKVGEALRLFASLYRKKGNVEDTIERLGLGESLSSRFKDLSGGWKQRVALALATLHDPKILFLDEPSAGLDPQARRELWSFILKLKEMGKTVVLTTHYMEEAERLADRIAIFHKGEIIAQDATKNLVAQMAKANYLSFASDEADLDMIRNLSGVEKVEKEEGMIRLYTPTPQETTLALFQLAREQEWKIEDFRYERGTLEDFYVHLFEKERLE